MLYMTANGCLWETAELGSSTTYDALVKGWNRLNAENADSRPTIMESDYPKISFFNRHIKPTPLRRLLLSMLNPDPFKRATIAEVAKYRWMKTVQCCQLDTYEDPTSVIDASKSRSGPKSVSKIVHHNHLPPPRHLGHKLIRLPGSTDMS